MLHGPARPGPAPRGAVRRQRGPSPLAGLGPVGRVAEAREARALFIFDSLKYPKAVSSVADNVGGPAGHGFDSGVGLSIISYLASRMGDEIWGNGSFGWAGRRAASADSEFDGVGSSGSQLLLLRSSF